MITEQFKENVKKLYIFEKYRNEQHTNEKIDESCSPVDAYNDFKDSFQVRYSNLVITKNKKIPKLIKTIGKWKTIGGFIQFLALLNFVYIILMLSVYKENLLDYPRYNWDEGLYMAYMLLVILGPALLLIIGGFVRIIGRKPFAEYIEVWNPMKAPVEVVRLSDGRVAIISYLTRDMNKGKYLKAVSASGEPLTTHPIWESTEYEDDAVMKYCYIIDAIHSLKETRDGFEIVSSGQFKGLRIAGYTHNKRRNTNIRMPYYLWTECDVKHRKEVIPNIFENMEYLGTDLKNLLVK